MPGGNLVCPDITEGSDILLRPLGVLSVDGYRLQGGLVRFVVNLALHTDGAIEYIRCYVTAHNLDNTVAPGAFNRDTSVCHCLSFENLGLLPVTIVYFHSKAR